MTNTALGKQSKASKQTKPHRQGADAAGLLWHLPALVTRTPSSHHCCSSSV